MRLSIYIGSLAMIRFCCVALLVPLCILAVFAPASADALDGNQLQTYCLSDNPGDQVICIVYITGVVDALTTVERVGEDLSQSPPQICLAPTTGPEELQRMIIKWLARPETNHEYSASLLIWLAVQNHYPCTS